MKKTERHEPYCGCQACKPVLGKPAIELRHMINMLDRQAEERNQRKEREKKE